VNIVDETGKRVYVNNTLNDRIHAINLSTIPKGVYTIQIMSTNVYKNRCLFYNKSSLQTKIQSGL
ncbi:MAG: T9SS type A sorting domain-containing protein, partial [Crocinitomicaceae bacterium]